jgi:rsbT co-antagonist protein RsbR
MNMHTDDSEIQLERDAADDSGQDEHQVLPQLVAHLREHRTKLRQQWVTRIQDTHLLEAMTLQEMEVETTSVSTRSR